jgi:gamma-glutamylaminecyclotransferase
MNPLIFVYGTLKRQGENHGQLSGQQFVGTARTAPGFRLYDVGGYPGMVRVPGDCDGVTGEVWSVDAGCLARLDAFEGVPEGLYVRERVPLLPPFDQAEVEAYIYPHATTGRTELGSTWVE